MPFLEPEHVSAHLVLRVELLALDETFGKTKCHRSVVRPHPRFQTEVAAADHVVDRFEASRPAELQCGSEGVAGRKPQ